MEALAAGAIIHPYFKKEQIRENRKFRIRRAKREMAEFRGRDNANGNGKEEREKEKKKRGSPKTK